MRYKYQRNLLNWQREQFEGAGRYGMPILHGVPINEYQRDTHFLAFSDILAREGKPEDGVHFYLDDYRFERVWYRPTMYIEPLKRYSYAMSPDFSTYTDMPLALQLFSQYKRHWCAALWESEGIKVIPTISWSDRHSFSWCFDGEPIGSVVSVSSTGVTRDPEAVVRFNEGYAAMAQALEPALVLYFGKDILTDENRAAAPLEYHMTFSQDLTVRRNRGELNIAGRKHGSIYNAKLAHQ